MKAKKSFGQHFLINETITERITDSLPSNTDIEHIVEVGPGKGVLSKYLIERPEKLTLIEADRDMVSHLQSHFFGMRFDLIENDFLKVDLSSLSPKPFYLIGNYPYNISSQIIFKMLENKELIPQMVGMFQKEVGDRIVAAPGSKTYGVTSVLTQAWYSGELLFDVDPSNFAPPPKVQSTVIRLTRIENPDLSYDHKEFRKIVKSTFNTRRKMIRKTLKGLYPNYPNFDDPFFNKRPEALSVLEFIDLTKKLTPYLKA